jgi:hypothetical protein
VIQRGKRALKNPYHFLKLLLASLQSERIRFQEPSMYISDPNQMRHSIGICRDRCPQAIELSQKEVQIDFYIQSDILHNVHFVQAPMMSDEASSHAQLIYQ